MHIIVNMEKFIYVIYNIYIYIYIYVFYSYICICVCVYSSLQTFQQAQKSIIIEQLRDIRTTSTEILKERVKQRETFWIMKLETLAPLGLNQDLN